MYRGPGHYNALVNQLKSDITAVFPNALVFSGIPRREITEYPHFVVLVETKFSENHRNAVIRGMIQQFSIDIGARLTIPDGVEDLELYVMDAARKLMDQIMPTGTGGAIEAGAPTHYAGVCHTWYVQKISQVITEDDSNFLSFHMEMYAEASLQR